MVLSYVNAYETTGIAWCCVINFEIPEQQVQEERLPSLQPFRWQCTKTRFLFIKCQRRESNPYPL